VPAPKKVPQTDAIFAELKAVHADAEVARDTLRISLDAKATVKIGPFSRGGYSRTGNRGADHDFKPDGQLTPFGIFVPEVDELDLYFTHAKVTSDFMADALEEWWVRTRERLAGVREVRRLVIDLDNGPECQSRRTQWLYRMVRFAQQYQLIVQLCYYPPYHSKYNPIERCWGVLEGYWRGEILDSEAAILGYAGEMTYNGLHPRVHRVTGEYPSGVARTDEQMRELEALVDRLPGLEKWCVEIEPPSPDLIIP
jgi:Rhodopirellula transposase DDE domain